MKANQPKRRVFNDAIELLTGTESEGGVQMIPIDAIAPFRELYEGGAAKKLRICEGAGTSTAWTGKYVPVGTYTIVVVKDGKGSDVGWGRLKSGASGSR